MIWDWMKGLFAGRGESVKPEEKIAKVDELLREKVEVVSEVKGDVLHELKDLVDQHQSLKEEIAGLEATLKSARDEFNRVSGVLIPEIVHSRGLSELRLESGEKIKVKEDLSVTIGSDDEFHSWLAGRGEDDIVKLNFAFNRMAPEKRQALMGFLVDGGYDYTADRKVHYQTTRAYFRRLLGYGVEKEDYAEGLKSGRYTAEQDLPEWVTVFKYNKTTIS